MAIYQIDSLDEAGLGPYRNMKDKELARDGRRFIAEGEQVVRRLLASGLHTESLLITRRKLAAIAPLVPQEIPAFVAEDSMIQQVIGFEFHGGVLACGIRPEMTNLEKIMAAAPARSTLAVCRQISNTENLGALIRIAAGFGCDAMILDESCCDPFFRQSVRVSMGTVFRLPLVQSDNLLRDLDELRHKWGFERWATVLGSDAQPLANAVRGERVAVLFGNEAQGLDASILAACDRKVTIPMKWGTDSLNVAVAAGVVLYHLTMECGSGGEI